METLDLLIIVGVCIGSFLGCLGCVYYCLYCLKIDRRKVVKDRYYLKPEEEVIVEPPDLTPVMPKYHVRGKKVKKEYVGRRNKVAAAEEARRKAEDNMKSTEKTASVFWKICLCGKRSNKKRLLMPIAEKTLDTDVENPPIYDDVLEENANEENKITTNANIGIIDETNNTDIDMEPICEVRNDNNEETTENEENLEQALDEKKKKRKTILTDEEIAFRQRLKEKQAKRTRKVFETKIENDFVEMVILDQFTLTLIQCDC